MTVIDVVPEGTSQGPVAMGLVDDIRAEAATVADADASFGAEVGGIAASTLDAREMIGSRIPWAIGIVVAATLAPTGLPVTLTSADMPLQMAPATALTTMLSE